jgi:hypothetical protein
MGKVFTSREAVSPIRMIICNEEPLMGFGCVSEQNHIYMQVLQLFTQLIAPPPNAICVTRYDFDRAMNSSSHFVSLSEVHHCNDHYFVLL